MIKDYYQILGISSNSNHEEIKAAYEKKLEEKFGKSNIDTSKITEAFETLSNRAKRKKYDNVLLESLLQENDKSLLEIKEKAKFNLKRDYFNRKNFNIAIWIEMLATLIISLLLIYSNKSCGKEQGVSPEIVKAAQLSEIEVFCNVTTFNEFEVFTKQMDSEIPLSRYQLYSILRDISFNLRSCKSCLIKISDSVRSEKNQSDCISNLYELVDNEEMKILTSEFLNRRSDFKSLNRLFLSYNDLLNLYQAINENNIELNRAIERIEEFRVKFSNIGCI